MRKGLWYQPIGRGRSANRLHQRLERWVVSQTEKVRILTHPHWLHLTLGHRITQQADGDVALAEKGGNLRAREGVGLT